MDNRTKRQKLEAMANQKSSPLEAEIAKEKLKKLDNENSPPIPDSKIINVSTWIDYGRGKVITKITFADGRTSEKEIDLFTTSGWYQATASYTFTATTKITRS